MPVLNPSPPELVVVPPGVVTDTVPTTDVAGTSNVTVVVGAGGSWENVAGYVTDAGSCAVTGTALLLWLQVEPDGGVDD